MRSHYFIWKHRHPYTMTKVEGRKRDETEEGAK